MFKKKKLYVITICLLLLFVIFLFLITQIKSKESIENIKNTNENIEEQIEQTTIIEDNISEEQIEKQEEILINQPIENTETEVKVENIIEDKNNITKSENTNSTISKNNTTVISKETKPKKKETKQETQTKEETISTTQTTSIENSQNTQEIVKEETKNETTQETAQEQPKNTTQKPKEEYIRNDEMINTIKQALKNNESDYMKKFGYEIVVDSSIKELATPFTFTEKRLKSCTKYSFGTIKIYAEDLYKNGVYQTTFSYIL